MGGGGGRGAGKLKEDKMTINELLSGLKGVKRSGRNGYTAFCPAHDDKKNRSLSVRAMDDGSIAVKCFCGCSTQDICSALGITKEDLMSGKDSLKTHEEKRDEFLHWYADSNGLTYRALYDYCYGSYDDGLCKAKFTDRDGKKTFRWLHGDDAARSGYRFGRGECPHRLYAAGPIDTAEVFILEGEKDCDSFHALTGKTAVCTENGASEGIAGDKWLEAYTKQLAGKKVYILYDNDRVGRVFAQTEYDAIKDVCNVTLLNLFSVWTDAPEKTDITDLIEAEGEQKALAYLSTLFASQNKTDDRDMPAPTDSSPQTYTKQSGTETGMASANDNSTPVYPEDGKGFDGFLSAIKTESYRPIPTGISFFDRLLSGGPMKQSVYLILAAPGAGKTTLMQQIAEGMAENGHPVIYLNLEMSRDQMYAKGISRLTSGMQTPMTSLSVLQGYGWDEGQKKTVMEAAEKYRQSILPYMDYKPDSINADVSSLTAYLEEKGKNALESGEKAPAVFLDYLHLVTDNGAGDQKETIKKTMMMLKNYAVRYNTTAFAISAVSRDSMRDGAITMNSGRDSSNLEYSADCMMALDLYEVMQGYISPADKNGQAEVERLMGLPQRNMMLKNLKNRFEAPSRKVQLLFDAEHNIFYGRDDFLPMSLAGEDNPFSRNSGYYEEKYKKSGKIKRTKIEKMPVRKAEGNNAEKMSLQEVIRMAGQ